MGLHSAPPTRSRWRRKVWGLPVVAWLVIAVAGAAIAALFAFARTAPDNFTVQAEGNLSAGFVTDVDQLFGDQLLEAGVPLTSCVVFSSGSATTQEEARIYASDFIEGGLGTAVNFTLRGKSLGSGTAGIDPTCGVFQDAGVLIYDGTLGDFGATATSWDTSPVNVFDQTTDGVRWWAAKFTIELDAAAAASTVDPADTVTSGFTFEARNATP